MNISRILLQLIFRDKKATPHVALSGICCALSSARRSSRRARLDHELVQPHRGAEVCESRVLLSAVTGQDIQPTVDPTFHDSPQNLSAVQHFPVSDRSTPSVQSPVRLVLESGRPETGISPGAAITAPGEIIISLPAGDEFDWFPLPDVDAPTILLPEGSNDSGDAEPGSSGFWTSKLPDMESIESDVLGSVIHDLVNQLLDGSWPGNDVRESADATAEQTPEHLFTIEAHGPSSTLVAGDEHSQHSSVRSAYESEMSPWSGNKSADEVLSNGFIRTPPSAIPGTDNTTERSDPKNRNGLSEGIPADRAINAAAFSLSVLLDTQYIHRANSQTWQPPDTVVQEFSTWCRPSAGEFFSQGWMIASQREVRHQQHWSLVDKGNHIQPEVLPSESTTAGRLVKQQEATARLLRQTVRDAYSGDPLPLEIAPGDSPEPESRSTARQRTLRYEIQPRAPPASEQPGLHFVSRYGHADLLRRLRFSIAPRGPSLASTVSVKSVSDTFRSLS